MGLGRFFKVTMIESEGIFQPSLFLRSTTYFNIIIRIDPWKRIYRIPLPETLWGLRIRPRRI